MPIKGIAFGLSSTYYPFTTHADGRSMNNKFVINPISAGGGVFLRFATKERYLIKGNTYMCLQELEGRCSPWLGQQEALCYSHQEEVSGHTDSFLSAGQVL
jgi:hypothetical protein